jgi:ABC-type nitrate/sulfonate/bicarbonate transport system permease component
MAQSVVEWTGDQIAEAARQASRAATALADALEESLGAARRIAKQGGDTAEELMDDTIKRMQRHPVETVIATFSIGIAAGITVGVATGILIARTIWLRNMVRRHFSPPGMRPLHGVSQ